MSLAFTLTTAQLDAFTNAIDTMIVTFGRPCELIYPGKMENCNNCVTFPGTGRSTARWRSGGPIPFQQGTACPQCGGSGQTVRVKEISEIITLKCDFDAGDERLKEPQITVTQSTSRCLVKGYFTDLPKLLRAEQVILASDLEPYKRYRYKLDGEPYDPHGLIKGRWFEAKMKRVA